MGRLRACFSFMSGSWQTSMEWSGTWFKVVCTSFRKDKLDLLDLLDLLVQSSMHKAARTTYAEMEQSKVTGGLPQAFQDALCVLC